MDNDVLVETRGVSKAFCRNLRQSMWYGLKDIGRELTARRRERQKLRPGEFWAVRDVTFDLRRGERLGLIGRNGAGKTSLLRMLNGLVKPDAGQITVRGRVGAMIALGAGFNPVLSGRENTYVNGCVLGLTKHEIDEKFDEIVDFAELRDAIDAPVRTYSSGMYVRLGFSVASFMDPDVLLIDEVLAVGDFDFRTKCLRRLNELNERGVAFILVSHGMTNIVQFCETAIWMERGRVEMQGPSTEVVAAYLEAAGAEKPRASLYGNSLSDHPHVRRVEVTLGNDSDGRGAGEIRHGDPATIHFRFETTVPLKVPNVSFPIFREDGKHATTLASIGYRRCLPRAGNAYAGSVCFGPVALNPGNYVMVGNLHDGTEHLFRGVVQRFRVKGPNRVTWGFVDFDQDWQLDGDVGAGGHEENHADPALQRRAG